MTYYPNPHDCERDIGDGVIVTGGHSHVLRWTYSKDAYIDAGADCGWLDNVRIFMAVDIGFYASDWSLGNYYQFSRTFTAYTGDLFPEPPKPIRPGFVFSGWHLPYIRSPNLNTNGEIRMYKVWGKVRLDDPNEQWQCPTNALHRFFKVSVEMP